MIIKSWIICKILTMLSFGEVLGVTIPPFIIIKPDQADERVIINHEQIHLAQASDYWYVGFYFVYGYYNIKNWIDTGSRVKSYEMNPFEREAFANEYDFDYLFLRKPFSHKYYTLQ